MGKDPINKMDSLDWRYNVAGGISVYYKPNRYQTRFSSELYIGHLFLKKRLNTDLVKEQELIKDLLKLMESYYGDSFS